MGNAQKKPGAGPEGRGARPDCTTQNDCVKRMPNVRGWIGIV